MELLRYLYSRKLLQSRQKKFSLVSNRLEFNSTLNVNNCCRVFNNFLGGRIF